MTINKYIPRANPERYSTTVSRFLTLVTVAAIVALDPRAAIADPTLITLASFDAANNSISGVTLDASDNLYVADSNNIFEIAAGTTSLKVLATGSVGVYNAPSLTLDANGDIIGPSSYGSTPGNYDGSVFELTKGSSTINTIAGFSGYNGIGPIGTLTIYDGNIYGTTYQGGGHNLGTVFEIAAGSGSISTIASFDYANGNTPYGGLAIDSKGDIFGATAGGLDGSYGTVFEIAAGTNKITTLVDFYAAGAGAGNDPNGGVILDSRGDIFGTTRYGGAYGYGTVFEIPAGTTTLETLASFDDDNGANPVSGLTIDANGNLFGTTTNGGTYDDGTIFEVAAGSNAITTLHSFDSADGGTPVSSLAIDAQGNLYGTTAYGGAYGYGTVFELTGAAVPEPSSILALGEGILALAGAVAYARRRASRSQGEMIADWMMKRDDETGTRLDDETGTG